MADDDGLAGNCIGAESSQERGGLGNIFDRREFAVHGIFNMTFFMTSCSERSSSVACSGICLSTSGMRTKSGQMTLARTPCAAPFLGSDLRQADQTMLGRKIKAP